MEVGLRVVRGPDWKWGNQDDSEGHVGTVVEIGKPGSLSTPDKTVVVQWDSGSRTNYRVGYQGVCDLRVFDNAPIGVKHPNIICNSCKKHGIAGMRWKCLECSHYDLCTSCYMGDKHDLNHTFARFETNNSIGVEMTKRSAKNAVKIQARGVFVGARVVRGCDWDWDNQDGGEGKVGKVIDIRGWDNESRRSVANVMWASGSTNVYRMGHKGKVDLKYVIDASGGYYYRDHLPILGQSQLHESPLKVEAACGTNALSPQSASCVFSVGDKVKVIVEDENDLKALQEGHGGWNPRMAQFSGQIGTVHRVTDRGDIRLQFEGCHNRWTFNPEALVKVTSYSVGDVVRIIDDLSKVKELQKSHGEWIDLMKEALGKMGKVVKVYADGDLRITVEGHTWTFNPLCVNPLPGMAMNNASSTHHQQPHESYPRFGNLLDGDNSRNDTSRQSEQLESERHVTDETAEEAQQDLQENAAEDFGLGLLRIGDSISREAINDIKCVICNDVFANVQFSPCFHQICCYECCFKMKRCIICQQQILEKVVFNRETGQISNIIDTSKTKKGNDSLFKSSAPENSADRLRYLELKIAEMEEANSCGICMERVKNVIFLCGHGACVNCAQTLKTCHMCRKTITKKINCY